MTALETETELIVNKMHMPAIFGFTFCPIIKYSQPFDYNGV